MALVKYNNNSLSSVTSAAGFPAGAMTHIKTLDYRNVEQYEGDHLFLKESIENESENKKD